MYEAQRSQGERQVSNFNVTPGIVRTTCLYWVPRNLGTSRSVVSFSPIISSFGDHLKRKKSEMRPFVFFLIVLFYHYHRTENSIVVYAQWKRPQGWSVPGEFRRRLVGQEPRNLQGEK